MFISSKPKASRGGIAIRKCRNIPNLLKIVSIQQIVVSANAAQAQPHKAKLKARYYNQAVGCERV